MPRIGGRKARAWSSDVQKEKTKLDRALSAENAYMSDSEVRISNHLGGYQRKEVYNLYLRRADRPRTLTIARRIGGEWAEEDLHQCAPSSIAADAQDPGAGESQPGGMLASASPVRLRRSESFSMDENRLEVWNQRIGRWDTFVIPGRNRLLHMLVIRRMEYAGRLDLLEEPRVRRSSPSINS
ncbi:hypothetical protein FOZ60_001898 [Perkinsus olseni]|uniref:Uncharacterized protein n=1 Tax=Perkinsus olseni TaxID=32597 RepID=A0A7J6PJU2_PEROL|nr:hypothetical protein FOZ60_001898 [Perkinsus olseni]